MELFGPLLPWAFGDLKYYHYNLIMADPPWQFQTYSEEGEEKSPSAQYECYEVEDIRDRFPIGQLADVTCLLLLWGTAPLLPRQIACLPWWGFEYKTLLYWHKVFPSGKTAMGTGYRVRTMAEPLIVATRGNPVHRPLPGLFQGVRREHSRKPEEIYSIIDHCCPDLKRRADVFARQRRPFWEPFGNEVDKFAEEPIE